MNYYISDLHFGHEKVIDFDKRPFSDCGSMDLELIQRWNDKVSEGDDIFIVGDFCFRNSHSPDWYLKQLKGHKHLIIGNHDRITLECKEATQYLESMDKMLHVADRGRHICLCHYPLVEWYKCQRGSWHIYGHIHGARDESYEFMKRKEHALNAAACINHYAPASFDELIKNNRAFQQME